MDPDEYCRLRQRPIQFEAAITFLKIEPVKEANKVSQNLSGTDSVDAAAGALSPINLSSISGKSNSIDSIFRLCVIDTPPVFAPSMEKKRSVEEEIGHYISPINMDQHLKFSNF